MAPDTLNSSILDNVTNNSAQLSSKVADAGLAATAIHPDIIMAVGIIAFSALLAIVSRYIALQLYRKAVKTPVLMDDVITKLAVTQVPPAIVLLGIAASLSVSGLSEPYLKYITILFLLLVAQTLSKGLRHLIEAYPDIMDEHVRSTVRYLGSAIIYSVAFLQILNILEFPIATVLASMGILGIAIAIAIQPTLSSIFAGILLVMDKPFDLEDQITLSGENRGIVKEIGFRSTKVLTSDNILVSIPNSEILNRDITNYTRDARKRKNSAIRVRLDIGISYESDIEKARGIMVDAAYNNTHTHRSYQKPIALLLNYGDSSLDFQLRFWIKDSLDRDMITDEVLTEIKKRFDEAGIEIPYPRRYLIMDKKNS